MPNETGNAKNVANVKTLQTNVEDFDAKQNLRKDSLKVDSAKSIDIEDGNMAEKPESAKLERSLAVDEQNAGFESPDDQVLPVVSLNKAMVDDLEQVEQEPG